MTPPPPVQTCADEYDDAPPAHWLGAWATIRRALALVGALVIVAAVAGLAGYAVGRHAVAPRPGEEVRLDSAIATLAATADSARKAAEWEHAQRVIAEQRAAALPSVTIREPGVIVIGPVTSGDMSARIEPHMVVVPVEVTAALDAERRVNAALWGELRAVQAVADAERARADSLARAVVLARSDRRHWYSDRVVVYAGRSVSGRWDAGVGVALWRWP